MSFERDDDLRSTTFACPRRRFGSDPHPTQTVRSPRSAARRRQSDALDRFADQTIKAPSTPASRGAHHAWCLQRRAPRRGSASGPTSASHGPVRVRSRSATPASWIRMLGGFGGTAHAPSRDVPVRPPPSARTRLPSSGPRRSARRRRSAPSAARRRGGATPLQRDFNWSIPSRNAERLPRSGRVPGSACARRHDRRHPLSWAGVGAANDPLNHARVAGLKRSSALTAPLPRAAHANSVVRPCVRSPQCSSPRLLLRPPRSARDHPRRSSRGAWPTSSDADRRGITVNRDAVSGTVTMNVVDFDSTRRRS